MQKLLVVEDQADIRALIRATLEYESYELHEAEDGAGGLHMARALRPALMLLDVMMPGELDGIQVCERLKKDPATAGIRIILLTARGQKTDVAVGQAAGCDAYLIKPFSPLQLIETIEQLLAAAPGRT
jgi:CheY-like chemotaxis protein